MAEMRYSREVGDEEYDVINNQAVAQECLAAGCQCGFKDAEIERLRKAMKTIVAYESDNPAPRSYFAGVNDMAAIARRALPSSDFKTEKGDG